MSSNAGSLLRSRRVSARRWRWSWQSVDQHSPDTWIGNLVSRCDAELRPLWGGDEVFQLDRTALPRSGTFTTVWPAETDLDATEG